MDGLCLCPQVFVLVAAVWRPVAAAPACARSVAGAVEPAAGAQAQAASEPHAVAAPVAALRAGAQAELVESLAV